jgi:hypothetical protein
MILFKVVDLGHAELGGDFPLLGFLGFANWDLLTTCVSATSTRLAVLGVMMSQIWWWNCWRISGWMENGLIL